MSRILRHVLAGLLLAAHPPAASAGERAGSVPLVPDAWTATDSIRFLPYLGRPALWINRGVALARGVAMEHGVLEMDVAASDTTNFLGVVFRAAGPTFSNVLFLRPGASESEEAVQYGPAFNSVGVAWQVFHGEGANAVAEVPRNRWVHLRVELAGPVARLYLDGATIPTLVVPRVVTSGGAGIGVWAGAFGRGAYFSNIRYVPAPAPPPAPPAPAPPPGSLLAWELSGPVDPAEFTPGTLPDMARLEWQPVEPEPDGLVLINRYRESPVGGVPRDASGAVLADSVMTGRIAGSRIVYARTTVHSPRRETRRMQYAYSNGVVIYLNGRPLAFAMNPGGLRGIGAMARVGDAVYLPLEPGANHIVLAVIQATGGWAFSARLDPP